MCYGEQDKILGSYRPMWGLHFVIHILLGVVASLAGILVIFHLGEVLNGAALCGAGGFALLNGWQGCKDLEKSKGAQGYRSSN